jgi:hypothetical protein
MTQRPETVRLCNMGGCDDEYRWTASNWSKVRRLEISLVYILRMSIGCSVQRVVAKESNRENCFAPIEMEGPMNTANALTITSLNEFVLATLRHVSYLGDITN